MRLTQYATLKVCHIVLIQVRNKAPRGKTILLNVSHLGALFRKSKTGNRKLPYICVGLESRLRAQHDHGYQIA